MSQYGAYGYALHGYGYRFILGHYFTDTGIGTTNPNRVVRVLMQSGVGSASFRGATRACGRGLSSSSSYRVQGAGSRLALLTAGGRRIATCGAPLRADGPHPLRLYGPVTDGVTSGTYRGALEFRPDGSGGVRAINAVGLDSYLRGVVPGEVPASWAAEALKAQAVAARGYAITATVGGHGYDLYAGQSSQVYDGVAGEQPSTDAAVAATRGQVVTYHGRAVPTFFFSTSGGRTENVEDSFLGAPAAHWLQSVDDPYDSIAPLHSWGPYAMTLGQAGAKLAGLVHGSFRGIAVTRRGHSPRVVSARILGSRGSTTVSGPELKYRFGLYDTWAYYTVVSTDARGRWLVGRVQPGPRHAHFDVERRTAGRWHRVERGRLEGGGAYRRAVPAAGLYRIRYAGLAGPAVSVR